MAVNGDLALLYHGSIVSLALPTMRALGANSDRGRCRRGPAASMARLSWFKPQLAISITVT